MLLRYSKVAIFQPEQRKLRSCDFPAGAAKAYVACCFGTESCDFPAGLRVQLSYLKLRFSSRSCESVLRAQKLRRSCESVLRLLLSYLKVAIFQLELPRTRGESNPRPRDCESRRANHETTSKGHFASNKIVTGNGDEPFSGSFDHGTFGCFD